MRLPHLDSEARKANDNSFPERAKTKLYNHITEVKGEPELHRQPVGNNIKPLSESLEAWRQGAYEKVKITFMQIESSYSAALHAGPGLYLRNAQP